MPFYLPRFCPAHEAHQEGRRDRRAYTHLLLGLHLPLRVAIPPPTSSVPLQGQSPRPEGTPQLTEMSQHHPQNAPASPLTVTFEERQAGEESLYQLARRRPALQSPRPPPRPPGARGASPPALTLAGAGVSARRGRTGAAGGVPGLPTRGAAGPALAAGGCAVPGGRQVPGTAPVPFSTLPFPPRFPSGGRARLKYQSRPSRRAQELTSAAPGF